MEPNQVPASNEADNDCDGNNQLPTTPTVPVDIGPYPVTPNEQTQTHTPRSTRTPPDQMLRPLRSSTPTPRRNGDVQDEISDIVDVSDVDISSLSPVSSPNPSVLVFSDDSDYHVPIRDVIIIPNRRPTVSRRRVSPPRNAVPLRTTTIASTATAPRTNLNLEFEVASYDDELSDNPIENADSSSDADSDSVNSFIQTDIAHLNSKEQLENDEITDSEASSEPSSVNSNQGNGFLTDSEIDEKDHWFCTQCKVETNKPYLRYCLRCFRIRREWLPKRPKSNRKRPSKNLTDDKDGGTQSQDQNLNLAFVQSESQSLSMGSLSQESRSNEVGVDEMEIETDIPKTLESDNPKASTSTNSTNSICISDIPNSNPLQTSTTSSNSLLKTKYPESNFLEDMLDAPPLKVAKLSGSGKSSSDGTESLCSICMVRERNAAFVHGKSAHLCTCYSCGDKILKKSGKCPICRKRILRVVKIIVA